MAKETARERRERLEAARKKTFQSSEAERNKQKVEEEKKHREELYKKELLEIENKDPQMAKIKKSNVKATGMKSAFIMDRNSVLVTGFGRGNTAVREKKVEKTTVTDISDKPMFDLSVTKECKNYQVSGNGMSALAWNPTSSKTVGMDQILLKDKLEEMYFGQTFEDNIHIQLIYKILDIDKILSVHVNNVIFTLNNIVRDADYPVYDLIGEMRTNETYKKFVKKNPNRFTLFCKFANKEQLGYFGPEFMPSNDKNKREEEREKCYYLLVALGLMRHSVAHGGEDIRAKIYNLDKPYKDSGKEPVRIAVCNLIDRIYRESVDRLNKDFLDHSKKDLQFLISVFRIKSDEDKLRLVEDYYEYVVKKPYKNSGFSIKRIREIIKNRIEPELSDEQYDSVRPRLNRTVDYVIWRYYRSEKGQLEAETLISRLRQAKTESHKEMVYRETARILWKEIENTVKAVLRYMDGEVLRDMNGYQDDSISIDSFKIPNYADKFSELIYLLTLFLDGKEINDLLTQLISAFENIDGFLSVLSEEHMSTELNEKYLIFLRSKEIAEELRVINSFARMTKNEEKEDKSKTTDEGENTKEETESKEQRVNCVKRIQFLEAAQVLGYDGDIDRLNAIADECIDINNEHFNKGLRNFISKNVINSVRFKYLVRYGKPENIRKIASNRKIVDFVLKDIPDEQITRYYNSCKGTRMSFFEEMRGELAERIIELKIEDFYKIPVGNELTNKEKEDKEKKKNIIRLYLTVVYQFYKNLVYVNSRYFLAFHCAERDGLIVDPDEYSELAIKEDMAKFAREWYEKERHSERVKEYLKEDFAHSDTWAIRRYRDGVEHLNVIRKASDYIDGIKEFSSYFEIYHYLIQRHLKAQFLYDSNTIGEKTQALIITKEQLNPKTYEYLCFAETYGVYRKDFVKALNVPFAYNLVRFKNLSIECLFDRNAFRPNEEE